MGRKIHPIIIFEPEGVRALGPPVMTRAVWDVRVGPHSSGELLTRRFASEGAAPSFWCRPELRDFQPLPAEEVFQAAEILLLAGHQFPLDDRGCEGLSELARGERLESGGELLAALLPGAEARDFLLGLNWTERTPAVSDEIRWGPLGPLLSCWWEIFELAPTILEAQLPTLRETEGWRSPKRRDWPSAGDCLLAPGALTAPGVILDASDGPVVLHGQVDVGAGAYVQGPCSLGPGTKVKPHSQLLHGCFTGPQCRLGGEVEWTQFQGFGNKQHHGFLGHAVLGEWVNLGAGVTNSDLKNNYSPVRVNQGERDLDTRRLFVGSCLGDHVKVGIQGRLNTGSVMDPFCNWFGAGFPPKYLPAYTWGADTGLAEYDLDKALATADAVMKRRGRELDAAHASVYRWIFQETATARARFG